MSRRGFSLIEVVVTLFLAATVTAAVSRSLVLILRNGTSSSERLAASWIARTTQEEARMTPTDLEAGEHSDVVTTSDGSLRRTVTIHEEGDPRLLRVTVSVGSPPVVLTTRLYRRWGRP